MSSRTRASLGRTLDGLSSFGGTKIVQTRLIVSVAVILLVRFTSLFDDPSLLVLVLLLYIGATLSIGFVFSKAIERKRIRALPILFDLLAISFIVSSTGGFESSWFVLYLFPVLSAARYLGWFWSLCVAILAAGLYGVSIFAQGSPIVGSALCLRIFTLIGVALTAANLARMRNRSEAKLIQAIEQIDQEILNSSDLQGVMRLILDTVLDLTNSDVSAILQLDREEIVGSFSQAKPVKRGSIESERSSAEQLLTRYYRRALESGEPLLLPEQRSWFAALRASILRSGTSSLWPGRLVPLTLHGVPFGALGVFSRSPLHYYTPNDLRKLSTLASLIAIAQKNANSYRALTSREAESQARLEMLYEIGEKLKAEQGPEQVFQSVVTLVADRLRSEEAALFIPDEFGQLVKQAVAGPTPEITGILKEIEKPYAGGRALTWQVFAKKQGNLKNPIPSDEDYASEYSRELPSRVTRHYLGVPLLIGDEVLGVIRVLNKKALSYAPRDGEARLAKEGFGEEDRSLLALIATQVVSAIRNAKFVEKSRYFENLVYNSPDPIIVLDGAGNIKNFNRECEKIWGVREEDVLGRSVGDYYESRSHAKEVREALKRADKHTIQDYDARIRNVSGRIIPIRLSATLLLDKDDAPIGSIGIFKDQREILRMQEVQMRTEKLTAIGKLAQTLGHDMKHDLGAVLNYLRGLEYEVRNDPEKAQVYSAMRTATTQAVGKLQNMLMTAKPKPPDKRVISVKAFLDTFLASSKHQAAAAQVDFSLDCPDGNLCILADAEQIRQVLANLFGNSFDAIRRARADQARPSAGKIRLEVEAEGDFVRLLWSDDGCGMNDEARAKAFTPFFTTKDTGSGLGLFITKTIVESHGGQVSVTPRGAVGTAFCIALPLSTLVLSLQGG